MPAAITPHLVGFHAGVDWADNLDAIPVGAKPIHSNVVGGGGLLLLDGCALFDGLGGFLLLGLCDGCLILFSRLIAFAGLAPYFVEAGAGHPDRQSCAGRW